MQMYKWYERNQKLQDIYMAGRIRLIRNLAHTPYPANLSGPDAGKVLTTLLNGVRETGQELGETFSELDAGTLSDQERMALWERRAINKNASEAGGAAAVLLSGDEHVSVTLNGEDHIRLQYIAPGQQLEKLWAEADAFDDALSTHLPLAFHEKYGYLTAYPTNMGTGMRAAITLHLPILSAGRKFGKLVNEIGRFGLSVQGLYGEGSENYGALYEISNQNTLGLTEEEILSQVRQMAKRLAEREQQVREEALRLHRTDLEDEIFKSYGVLKYARKLSVKEAMTYLSQLQMGEAAGVLSFAEPFPFYELVLGLQPAMLAMTAADEKTDLSQARARMVQSRLPELNRR